MSRIAVIAIGILAIILFATWGIDNLLWLLPFVEPKLEDGLSSVQEKQIDIYVEMTTQLLTLATIVLGAVGTAFFRLVSEPGPQAVQGERHILLLTGALAAVSVYIGYLSYTSTVWMLEKDFFNLDTPILHWLRIGQLWSLIFALAFLVVALWHQLNKRQVG
jgi:hypothetical protein